MCGVRMTFGRVKRGCEAGSGSGSVTLYAGQGQFSPEDHRLTAHSRLAPPIRSVPVAAGSSPSAVSAVSALTSATWSTVSPRPILTKTAEPFIAFSSDSPMSFVVAAELGSVSTTTSHALKKAALASGEEDA